MRNLHNSAKYSQHKVNYEKVSDIDPIDLHSSISPVY